jgi:transcriptional regulator GlxA family with amidase domain
VSPVRSRDVAERILRALHPVVPDSLLPAFRFSLEHPEEPLTVAQAAARCGIKRRALEYRFRRAGLGPPGNCLVICRLLLAVHHLAHRPDSIEKVAQAFGFGTAGALRKSLARHLGSAPHLLRRAGAFDSILLGLPDAIRRGRHTRSSH